MRIPLPDVDAILRAAINDISDSNVVAELSKYLVVPRLVMRDWDYAEDTKYPCSIVAIDSATQTAIAYCEFGFGPGTPWGILNEPSQHNEMGMDCCWYSSLEDAFRQSMMWHGDNPPDYEVQ
jgi:hypothetical protein